MNTALHHKRRRTSSFFAVQLSLVILSSLVCLIPSLSMAQEMHPTESQVEAAYLYNFGKFVTWPAVRIPVPTKFEICILGRDPFGEVLDSTVRGESIDHKTIVVERLSSLQDAPQCNILFISASEENRLPAILAAAQKMNLLTVSDIKHFAERGGAIGLVAQQGRIRFEVNRSAAEQCHLVLSSELLKVAVRVIQDSHSGS